MTFYDTFEISTNVYHPKIGDVHGCIKSTENPIRRQIYLHFKWINIKITTCHNSVI